MEQGVCDHLTSVINARGVELRIATVTVPSICDGVHMARTATFTKTVKQKCSTAHRMATATGINQLTLDLDATEGTHDAV